MFWETDRPLRFGLLFETHRHFLNFAIIVVCRATLYYRKVCIDLGAVLGVKSKYKIGRYVAGKVLVVRGVLSLMFVFVI